MTDEQDPLRIEKEIGRRTRAENAVEVGLCERCFQHLGKGFNQLERPYVWEEPKGTILLLATMGYNSLRWAWELLLKGYYTQANAMSRMGWECWLHGAYLLLYPENLEEWRASDTQQVAVLRERVAARAGMSGQSHGIDAEEFRTGMAQMYRGYSGHVHPNDRTLQVLLETRGDAPWLRVGGAYDGILVRDSTNLFCSAAMLLFTLFYELIPQDQEYQERGNTLRAEVAAWRVQLKGQSEPSA